MSIDEARRRIEVEAEKAHAAVIANAPKLNGETNVEYDAGYRDGLVAALDILRGRQADGLDA